MNADLSHVLQVMTYATGDEKHDSSTHSTLDVLWVLYDRILHYDPRHPADEDRDRFVLSKGHGPVAFYAILADKGFFPVETLKTFGAWDSILGSHPDHNKVSGVEVSTGSLGHGLPMAIGMAIALRIKGNHRRVFALIGDGECNEGSISVSLMSCSHSMAHQRNTMKQLALHLTLSVHVFSVSWWIHTIESGNWRR